MMMHSSDSNTNRISDIIDIQKLERENRRFLYLGVVVAIIVHFLFGIYLSYKLSGFRPVVVEKERRAPIPVELIILPPHTINPYETWKRIIPERQPEEQSRPSYRTPSGEVHVKPAPPYEPYVEDYTIDTDALVQAILEADIPDEIKRKIDPPPFVIPRIYQELKTSREPKRRFSIRDDLLRPEDIDMLGVYKAFVIIDPENKQNIRGYMHIPKYIIEMKLQEMASYDLTEVPVGLAEAFHFHTGIRMKVDPPLSLKDFTLFDYPLIYLSTVVMGVLRIQPYKIKNLGEYLRNGGFAIVDNSRPWKDYSPTEASLLSLLFDALGDDCRIDMLPRDHPLYHCFFDFNDPLKGVTGIASASSPTLVPKGAEDWLEPMEKYIPYWGEFLHDTKLNALREKISAHPDALWGVWVGERLVAIYSDKGYGHFWRTGVTRSLQYSHRGGNAVGDNQPQDNDDRLGLFFTPQMKIGVNIIMLALIQQGGIAQRVVDYDAQRPNRR